jgi:hypothetical protein
MSTHRDNDEILSDRILRMGPELGRIHHDLWAQLVWLHAKWRIHQDLFAGDESQTRLMEATAVQTFNQVYVSLTNEIIMHICRITDKAKTGQFENATIWQLPQLVQHPVARDHVAALVAEADAMCTSARGTRDKFLAHRDLNAALYPDALPRDHVRTDDIRDVLALIAAVLNGVEVAYGGAAARYDLNSHFSDAGRLIRVMQAGAKAQQEDRRRRGLGSDDSES